jgi:hypothetical protein
MTTITVSNNEKIPASNAVTNTRAIYSSQSRQRAGMALRVLSYQTEGRCAFRRKF